MGQEDGHGRWRAAKRATRPLPSRACKANTRYYYRLRYRPAGSGAFLARPRVLRSSPSGATGNTFTFELQGDSHPERVGKQFDADMYRQTLGMVAADKPDFYLMHGRRLQRRHAQGR